MNGFSQHRYRSISPSLAKAKILPSLMVMSCGLTSVATVWLSSGWLSSGWLSDDRAIAQPAPKPSEAPVQATPQPLPAPIPTAKKLLGQWLTKEPLEGDTVMFVFAPDGKAFIISGTSASGNAIASQFQYRIDDKPQPMHLDIVLAPDAIVQTLFEFTANGELRLQMLGTRPGKPRPAALTDNATLFQKISDDTTPPPGTELEKPAAQTK